MIFNQMNYGETVFVVTMTLAALVVGSGALYAHLKEKNEKKQNSEPKQR